MDSLLHDEEESNLSAESKKSPKADVEAVNAVPENNEANEEIHQRTRLPSFSSIIAGSPKSELHDICLGNEAEAPQVPEEHTTPASSRRASIDTDQRPNLDMRRCSLDQTFQSPLNATQQDSMARRASIDNGLMIRSTLDTSGFVETFQNEILPSLGKESFF